MYLRTTVYMFYAENNEECVKILLSGWHIIHQSSRECRYIHLLLPIHHTQKHISNLLSVNQAIFMSIHNSMLSIFRSIVCSFVCLLHASAGSTFDRYGKASKKKVMRAICCHFSKSQKETKLMLIRHLAAKRQGQHFSTTATTTKICLKNGVVGRLMFPI